MKLATPNHIAPNTRTKVLGITITLALATFSTGCTTTQGGGSNIFKETFASNDPCLNNARNIGIVGGAVAGAVLEKVLFAKGKKGVPVAGIAIGAALGGFIGADMDRRRCELSKVAKANNLDVVMAPIKAGTYKPTDESGAGKKPDDAIGLSLTVIDRGAQFETGKAIPSEKAKKAFAAIADQYHSQDANKDLAAKRNKRMRILLVGHTDDVGSSEANATLSEQRAKAIATIFAEQGFDKAQIFFQGAGEVFPIADNRSEQGRGLNRRVEVVDLSDDAAFAAFLDSRRPNLAFYRPVDPSAQTLTRSPDGVSSAPTKKIVASSNQKSTKTSPSVPSKIVATSEPIAPASVPSARPSVPSAPSTAVAKKVASPLDDMDLGGAPVNGDFRTADIGKTARASSFSLISSAYASDDAPVGNCAQDRPRISHGVKSLSTGEIYKTSDYLPGTATASWGQNVNGHYIGMANVAVLRDGGQPSGRPRFFAYKNYVKGSGAKPDYAAQPDVNAYQGEKALLYRVFLNTGPLQCIDMVIPNRTPSKAPDSTIVYSRNNALYQVAYSPQLIRN